MSGGSGFRGSSHRSECFQVEMQPSPKFNNELRIGPWWGGIGFTFGLNLEGLDDLSFAWVAVNELPKEIPHEEYLRFELVQGVL